MGQLDRFVKKSWTPPPRWTRFLLEFIAVVYLIRAVMHPQLENILWAAVLGYPATMLFAPRGLSDRADALARSHPVLGGIVGLGLLGSSAFVLLRYFLDRKLSSLIAFPVAAILVVVSAFRDRRSPTHSEEA